VVKKWARRLARVVLALLGLIGLAVAIAWFYVTSDAGAERVRRLALGAAGNALAGRLEAKRLRLSGGIVVVEDAKLFTPEGELVAELQRVEADVALLPLTRRDFVIRSARIDGLRVYLASDERGLNLVRAVSEKTPSPSSGGETPAFHVDIRGLELHSGYLSWQKEYALEGISIEGGARIAGPKLKLDGAATAHGEARGEPLELDVKGDEQKLGIALKLGPAHLDGDFNVLDVSGHIAELFVPPDVAARFVEGFPLQVPVSARAR
jgi:translocation and assembly module TamB